MGNMVWSRGEKRSKRKVWKDVGKVYEDEKIGEAGRLENTGTVG